MNDSKTQPFVDHWARAAAQQQVQLIITVLPNGALSVTGPLQNTMLCYGMLEMARDIIKKQSDKQEAGLMVVPAGAIPS